MYNHFFLKDIMKCPRNKKYFTPSNRQNAKTWSEADAFCKGVDSTLAKITTAEEQFIVERIL